MSDETESEAREESIGSFWSWFSAKEPDLRSISGDSDSVCDDLLRAIQQIDKRLYFEMCVNATPCEFIVTASGHTEVFPLAEAVIAAAPPLPGWKFVALKPSMGFDFKTTYKGIAFDSKEMWFLPLVKESEPTALGLRVGIPNYDPSIEQQSMFAVFTILDTALGERSAALDIAHLEVGVLPTDPQAERYIPLTTLPTYIQWRKGKQATHDV